MDLLGVSPRFTLMFEAIFCPRGFWAVVLLQWVVEAGLLSVSLCLPARCVSKLDWSCEEAISALFTALGGCAAAAMTAGSILMLR